MVVDKGAYAFVMAISYWRDLGSPDLVPSTNLLSSFNGRSFHTHNILPYFDIELKRKAVSVEVEVVDAHFYYNFILGGNWTYVMCYFPSCIFRYSCFLLKERLLKLIYCHLPKKLHVDTS